MKLTEEQSKMVEENHNLIYWYIHKVNLDIEEWYDLLAIELCYAVKLYDPSRGSFTNYFKVRADGAVYKEYRKNNAQKRICNELSYIENIETIPLEDTVILEESLEFQEFADKTNREILELKYNGYTQKEIAEKLQVSQSYISKILKKMRKQYDEFNWRSNR